MLAFFISLGFFGGFVGYNLNVGNWVKGLFYGNNRNENRPPVRESEEDLEEHPEERVAEENFNKNEFVSPEQTIQPTPNPLPSFIPTPGFKIHFVSVAYKNKESEESSLSQSSLQHTMELLLRYTEEKDDYIEFIDSFVCLESELIGFSEPSTSR